VQSGITERYSLMIRGVAVMNAEERRISPDGRIATPEAPNRPAGACKMLDRPHERFGSSFVA